MFVYVPRHEVATRNWVQAPEVLMGQRCTEKVDLFSLGVVLWEVRHCGLQARRRARCVRAWMQT